MAIRCFYLILHTGGGIHLHPNGRLRLHIECVRIGAGKRPKKYTPIPYSGWYERRTKEREEKARLALLAALEWIEEEEQAEAAKPENILYAAEKEIALQIMAEQIERQEKDKQRERAFTALEIGKHAGLQGSFRDKLKIRQTAKREAKRRLGKWDKEKERQDGIKAQRLYNLEKAKLAKAAKQKRQEEIQAQRLANLKKARAAKKRKRKKK